MENVSSGLLFEVLRSASASGGDVVLKRPVPAHRSSKRVCALLAREAEAATSMQGMGAPFVVGWDPTLAELRRSWVPGETLGQLRATMGAPSVATALLLFCKLLDLLERVHLAGWLLVDVSPSNVLLRPDGELSILDFGSARRNGAAPARAQDDLDPVAPGFASPEQAAGLPLEPASDVYAAARLAQWLLTGESGRAPHAVLAGSDLSPTMSRALLLAGAWRSRARLRSCLAKSIAERKADPAEVREACLRELRALGVPSSALRESSRTAFWSKNPRSRLYVAAASLLLTAVAFTLVVWSQRPVSGRLGTVQSAWVSVSASPWATCSVDGTAPSVTPVGAPWRVAPGSHRVRCEHPAAMPVEHTVVLSPGQREHVFVQMNVPGSDPFSPEALAEQFLKETGK